MDFRVCAVIFTLGVSLDDEAVSITKRARGMEDGGMVEADGWARRAWFERVARRCIRRRRRRWRRRRDHCERPRRRRDKTKGWRRCCVMCGWVGVWSERVGGRPTGSRDDRAHDSPSLMPLLLLLSLCSAALCCRLSVCPTHPCSPACRRAPLPAECRRTAPTPPRGCSRRVQSDGWQDGTTQRPSSPPSPCA